MGLLVRKVANADVVAQPAIAGVLTAAIRAYDAQASQAAQDIATRLDALAPDHETGWQGSSLADGALSFTRTLRGVTEKRATAGPLIRPSEPRRLAELASQLTWPYPRPGQPRPKDQPYGPPAPTGRHKTR